MSLAFSYCRRASSLTRPAICGSVRSTFGMGGLCITDLLGDEATQPGRPRQRGGDQRSFGTVIPGTDARQERAMATKIILDCDPGIDDALAITFAHGHPDLELLGITTVAGNVGLAQTTANALAVCEFIGAAGTPVTAGCAGPFLRPALDAREVHGESGLGGAVLPADRKSTRL